MLRPDYRQFKRLTQDATLVPISKSVTADLVSPVSAFLAVAADEPHAFLLESVEGGEKIGRYTFLGARPYCIVSGSGTQVTIQHQNHGKLRREIRNAPLLSVIREFLSQHRPAHIEGLPPFTGGAVG